MYHTDTSPTNRQSGRLRLAALAVLCLCGVPSTTPAATLQFHFDGSDTGFGYDYSTASTEENGDVVAFRLTLPASSLSGTIERPADDSLTVRVAVDRRTMAAVMVPGKQGDAYDIYADYFGAGRLHVQFDTLDDTLSLRSHDVSSCAALAGDEAFVVLDEAVVALSREYEIRWPNVPSHLEQLVEALSLLRSLPTRVPECHGLHEPRAGACYYDNPDFQGCLSCCQSDSAIAGTVCGMIPFCSGYMCRAAKAAICGGIVSLSQWGCASHNCRGKPGDPHCIPPKPPCPGTCMYFCGPGHSSECGECPFGQECCFP